MGGKEEKKEVIITAVYKLNLHCQECARSIEKSIISTGGVHKVDIDVESGKLTVKGMFDPKKMHGWIEKKSKRKVDWISPKPKEEKPAEKEKEKKEKKEEVIKTIVVKVQMHCERCEHDIKRKLHRLKGVHTVKTNRDAHTCTVVGTVEEKKVIEYLRKKVHKHGEIVPPKKEKKEKDEKEEEKKKEKEKEKDEKIEEKDGKEAEKKKEKDKKEEKEVWEVKEDLKLLEIKRNDVVVPYFIHCTHAPQWFSDEDPNACTVM